MTTLNQLVWLKVKRVKKQHKIRSKKLKRCPQKKGVVLKILFLHPKKPNSAIRKIARIRLSNGWRIRAGIPGQGHNLQQYSTVLVRGGRVKDVPGISYKLIRNKFDLSSAERITRKKARSKWGLRPIKKK